MSTPVTPARPSGLRVLAPLAALALAVGVAPACSDLPKEQLGALLSAFQVDIVDANGQSLFRYHLSDLVDAADLVRPAPGDAGQAAVRAARVKAIDRGAALLDDVGKKLQGLDPRSFGDVRAAVAGTFGLFVLAAQTGEPTLGKLAFASGNAPAVTGIEVRIGRTGPACATSDGALHTGRMDGGKLVAELCQGHTSVDTTVHELVHGLIDALVARHVPGATTGLAATPEAAAIEEAVADMMARSAALRLPVVGCPRCETVIGAQAVDPARACTSDAACGDRGACNRTPTQSGGAAGGACVSRPRFVTDGPVRADLGDWKPSPDCPEPWCHALVRAGLIRRLWLELDGGWRGPTGQRLPYRGVAVVPYGQRLAGEPVPALESVESLMWSVLANAPVDLTLAELEKGMLQAAAPDDKERIQSAFCGIGLPEKDKACSDADNDDIIAAVDNCDRWNPGQEDVDQDGIGDRCQPLVDSDGDGLKNQDDTCPAVPNPGAGQSDLDDDGKGDVCDSDMDGDGVDQTLSWSAPNAPRDNCPRTPNPLQGNMDGDGLGDACDDDRDGDGTPNLVDNCPDQRNADQKDSDKDGLGDVCDPDLDGDCIADKDDRCPFDRGCAKPAPELCAGCFAGAADAGAGMMSVVPPVFGPDAEATAAARRAPDAGLPACRARAAAARKECGRCPH
ncbi:MAG: thrombospondin type 3 repeat-containing protein [Myxococcota bacterium]